MAVKKKVKVTEAPENAVVSRKDIGARKKVQTAEGWRRTMAKRRDEMRKKTSSKSG